VNAQPSDGILREPIRENANVRHGQDYARRALDLSRTVCRYGPIFGPGSQARYRPGRNHTAEHGYFFVGGHYVEGEGGDLMEGSMYVEHFKPAKVTRPFPVVMIHGGGQTGTNFTGSLVPLRQARLGLVVGVAGVGGGDD
jgi:hypothetical protein